MGCRDAALLQLVRSARPEGPQRLPYVRTPDVRAAPLRGAHMRLAVPAILLTLALAGCGGATVTVEEVPGGPVDLSLPAGADQLGPAASPTPTPTPAATTAATAQATPAAD